jgi:hypothetical protein
MILLLITGGYLLAGIVAAVSLKLEGRLRFIEFQSKQFQGSQRTRFLAGVYVGIVLTWPQLFFRG